MSRMLAFLFLVTLFPNMLLAKEKIAVIGAGPAGLKAAQRLLEKGYEVKVFEKEKRVGGKCKTISESTGHGIIELGAIITSPFYDYVLEMMKKTGEKLRDYYPHYSLRYSKKDGHTFKTQSEEFIYSKNQKEIRKEESILIKAYKRFKPYKESDLKGIPEDSEFNTNFEDWADKQGLKNYKEIYRFWITSFGYGDLKEIPAYFPLYLIGPSQAVILGTRNNASMRMLANGYQGLMEKMVEHYKIPVLSGTRIFEIERGEDEVTVFYSSDAESKEIQKEKFDKLVVACGFECIDEFITEKTEEEKEILNAIHYSPYDVVIARSPKVKKGGTLIMQNLARPGHIALMSKNSPGEGEDIILYIPRGGVVKRGGNFQRPSDKDLKKRVIEDMADLGYDDVEIKTIQNWDKYFPHFMNPKYFDKLESLQGKNRTVYVGSLSRFEIVEKAMADADEKVAKYILETPKYTPYKVKGLKWVKQYLKWQFLALDKDKEL